MAEMDQASTLLTKTQPALWWNLFSECKNEGFSEEQAMELVKIFVSSCVSSCVKGPV